MEILINDSNIRVSTEEFIKMFGLFSDKDKRQIRKKINRELFAKEWNVLDSELPDIDMTEDDVLSEIQQVRYK